MPARENHLDETHIPAFLKTRKPGRFEPFTEPSESKRAQFSPCDASRELPLRISTPAICHIAELPLAHERPGISFVNYVYQCDRLTSSRARMRTIEFRMAGGSLNSEWIII
ncbi:hypothetical protein F5Y14DRAFT_452086 [Nemania sp. NC0429]|nr:hypothetical protein F5Y14DRAFT_452086 [Nemania sp. NC0429]